MTKFESRENSMNGSQYCVYLYYQENYENFKKVKSIGFKLSHESLYANF